MEKLNSQTSELLEVHTATITEDADRYMQMIRDKEELLESLIEAHADSKALRERQIEMDKKSWEKSIVFEANKVHLIKVRYHLEKFLQEFESAFDANGKCDSPQIAADYIEAAKYMADNFDRINNRIRWVEEWLENVPTEKRTDLI